jgi:hypothetical protein
MPQQETQRSDPLLLLLLLLLPYHAGWLCTESQRALTAERLSLLSAKNRGSIAWKDSSARPMRPVQTWGLHVTVSAAAAAVVGTMVSTMVGST